MSEYTMPVLSEQERDDLKKFILLSKDESAPNYSIEEIKRYMRLSMKIALAALTAKPIEYLTWHQGCRAPDDCEDYSVVASKGEKSCDGSDAFPVYTAPPVPVKQEGEQ